MNPSVVERTEHQTIFNQLRTCIKICLIELHHTETKKSKSIRKQNKPNH